MLRTDVERHLETRHGALLAFWTGGGVLPTASIEAHCDMVYSLALLGRDGDIPDEASEQFARLLRSKTLPGWEPEGDKAPILVHNCAYAFGALNLLREDPADLYETVLANRTERLSAIVDPQTNRPVFPAKWAHHNWRVSHWIGGVPSILLSLSRSGHREADRYAGLLGPVREATDNLIDRRTGLLRAYRSDLAQALFQRLYAFRHDPRLGNIGGVAHILWFDHAVGRRYVALEAILAESQSLFHERTPFMERVPYCLDFDIVQVVRTALDQSGADRAAETARAGQMMTAIERFFERGPEEAYTLHKIPGALATYHECALLAERNIRDEAGTPAFDIIKRGYWL